MTGKNITDNYYRLTGNISKLKCSIRIWLLLFFAFIVYFWLLFSWKPVVWSICQRNLTGNVIFIDFKLVILCHFHFAKIADPIRFICKIKSSPIQTAARSNSSAHKHAHTLTDWLTRTFSFGDNFSNRRSIYRSSLHSNVINFESTLNLLLQVANLAPLRYPFFIPFRFIHLDNCMAEREREKKKTEQSESRRFTIDKWQLNSK